MAWTSFDLPHIVARSAADYSELAHLWATEPALQEQPGAAASVAALDDQVDTLLSMPLTWLEKDVCDLVEQTYPTVPEWSPQACLPGPIGGIFFERPFAQIAFESQSGDEVMQVPLEGIAWTVDGGSVRISALSQLLGFRDHLSPLREHIPLHEVVAVATQLDAVTGAGIDIPVQAGRGIINASQMTSTAPQLMTIAGTIWLLLSQPIVADGSPVTAQVKRVHRQAGESARHPVNVSVKRLEGSARRGPGGGTGRKATSRWWVRGHWRQQPWGKGRKLRKPIYIEPHTAGAKDADVDVRPRVQVVKKQ